VPEIPSTYHGAQHMTLNETRIKATMLFSSADNGRSPHIYQMHKHGQPLDSFHIRFELDAAPTPIVTDGDISFHHVERGTPLEPTNAQRFCDELAAQYRELFATCSEYEYAAKRTTPEELARKMTLGLDNGTANKDGAGIQRTCKKLGIPHTYKAIRAFFADSDAPITAAFAAQQNG
jgi:hypothetical protein